MNNEELSVEESRARVRAMDTPLPPAPTQQAPAMHQLAPKEDESPSMWKVLLQLRVLLPYLSRLAPLLDGGARQATAQTLELQHSLSEAQSGPKELRTQLQDQTVQIKRVEEQVERLRETTERNTLEQQELVEDLKSLGGTIKALAAVGILLLLVNGGLLIYLLLRLRH